MKAEHEKRYDKINFFRDFCLNKKTAVKVSHKLKSVFSSADLVSVNFEGPLVSSLDSTPETKAGSILGQDQGLLDFVIPSGINVFNLANNHIMDFGETALKKTVAALSDKITIGAGLGFKKNLSKRDI